MRYRVKRSTLLVFWHRQRLVRYRLPLIFRPQLTHPAVQHGFSATAELLLIVGIVVGVVGIIAATVGIIAVAEDYSDDDGDDDDGDEDSNSGHSV